jgi:hypothetical protein
VKEYVPGGDSPYITFYYHSFDGEQGHMLKKTIRNLNICIRWHWQPHKKGQFISSGIYRPVLLST